MVHVNIDIPDDLHKKLKLASVVEDTTIKQLLVDILSEKGGRK